MIAILVGLIALGLLAVALFYASANNAKSGGILMPLGFVSMFMSIIGLVIWCVCAAHWYAAEHKVRIINETFGTHYTQAEVFWAEDVIDEVRELKRKRVELNGDLFREEKP